MRLSVTKLNRRKERTRGQSLVEFAFVVPIILLLFAAAADFGRLFYAFVTIESAVKEGAAFGAGNPLCDDNVGTGCGDPNNVVWRVRNELQNLRDTDGSELTPTAECLVRGSGTPRALQDCAEGDSYRVRLTYPFRLLTPILGDILGDLDVTSESEAIVFNLAFDPTPGISVRKLVSPDGAVNGSEVIANCLEIDDSEDGFYRSPCVNTLSPELGDVLYLHYFPGATIEYKVSVTNVGAQTVTGLVLDDTPGGWPSTSVDCPARPTSLTVGAEYVCTYARTAPAVATGVDESDFPNTVNAFSTQTLDNPPESAVVVVERPPAMFAVEKYVSTFREGDDGDGTPSFGTSDDADIAFNSITTDPTVWFKIVVTNVGGRTASAVTIADSSGALPFGQDDADADCDPAPASLGEGAVFECRYRVDYSSAATAVNTVDATSPDVTPDVDDSATATVNVTSCGGPDVVIPRLIGLDKPQAEAAWLAAGFSSTLGTWSGNDGATVLTQSEPAFGCVPANTAMTVTRTVTP